MTMPEIEFIRLPKPIPYGEALELQRTRHRKLLAGEKPEAVLLLEHTPVITVGRGSDAANVLCATEELADAAIEICETDRGGDVTYHGPGQLVAYPILDLNRRRRDAHWYLRMLEQVVIELLETYGLRGQRIHGLTGVWVDEAKVAAIGIGIRRWVTFHGVSLNVAPDMSHYRFIVPCGIADKPVTSLATLMDTPPLMSEVMARFEETFRHRFAVCSD